MLKPSVPLLLLLVHILTVSSKLSDSCDFENAELKKLCRKVESQDQYLAKMVDTLFKTDTVFKWYTVNKDWLTHPRLGRMIKRLLRRTAAESSGSQDSSSDSRSIDDIVPGESSPNSNDSEAKLQLIHKAIDNLANLLNETQVKIHSIENSTLSMATKTELSEVILKLNSSLRANLDSVTSEFAKSKQSVQQNLNEFAVSQNSKLALLENKVNSTTCECSRTGNVFQEGTATGESQNIKIAAIEGDLQEMKKQFEVNTREIERKLLLTSDDLTKNMLVTKTATEETMRNFSQNFDRVVNSLNSLFAERFSDNGGSNTYEMIINMTTVFNEDMLMVRNLVTQANKDVQYLLSQDTKMQRIMEELRTSSRKQEGNIQTINTQVNEFRNYVTDQLTSIRTSFVQLVNDFYSKLVERQNQISYRVTSIINDVQSIKTKVRAGDVIEDNPLVTAEEEDFSRINTFNNPLN